MKNGTLYLLLITFASIIGYTVATRSLEDSRDFR
ncbi:hypothetical protein SAMN05216232_2992 [Virgibacillus subterraneus]|uniref:Uncharacterized protein n=2 Tax=Virgibacillus TaxID=84406 RepID=A0A1H1CQU2_9BACI|nr:hypothetical protein SAMN05216231_2363 [Virgibacillus salinus]SEQ64854.1 hypothetical protein SAMN05216232_2992 [Virgibacillus subterraneus]